MDTLALLHLAAVGEGVDREEAFNQLSGSDHHYLPLLQSLAASADSGLTFWALFLLVKHFPQQLQRDAKQALPLLLACVERGDGPVCDRAAWALSLIGKPAVEALLTAIAAAPDELSAAQYIGALRGNTSVHLLASQVINLLSKQLDSQNKHVRFWALAVLMDIGPLRPWFDTRLPTVLFEPLYHKLLAVTQEFVSSKQKETATQYQELLMQALK